LARETRHRKRRGGCLGALVAVLLLLLVGLVVVDRVAAGVAEQRLADEVEKAAVAENAQTGATSAEINGFPFLTQVWSGEYDGGRIGLQTLRTEQLTIANVDIEVTELKVPRDVLFGAAPHDITAARMRGTATVSLAELASRTQLPGLKISGAGNGVSFTAPAEFAGLSAQVAGSANVRLEGSRVWLEVRDLSANGTQVPEQVLALIRSQLAAGVTIPQLPYALRLTGIGVEGEAVRVQVAADNVPLVR